MGNKSSRTARPGATRPPPPPSAAKDVSPVAPPPLAFLQSDAQVQRVVPRDGLSIDTAWAIATAWQDGLQNHVRLVTETDGVRSDIVDSYAWVYFYGLLETIMQLPDDLKAISTARAAALTWLALSCCPGYNGRENPTFWRCVFSEYAKRVDSSRESYSDGVQSVNDSIGFFDQPGHEFPRFSLSISGFLAATAQRSAMRLFGGAPGEQLHPEIEVRLTSLLDCLNPLVDARRLNRRVDMCIPSIGQLRDGSLETLSGADIDKPKTGVQAFTDTMLTFPFRLNQIQFESEVMIGTDADVDMLYGFYQRENLVIRNLKWGICADDRLSHAAISKFVGALLGLDGHHLLQAKTTMTMISAYRNSVFTALMAALPFTKDLHSIEVDSSVREKEFNRQDLPWIAYALFHPDAKTSSWRALALERTPYDGKSAKVITAMARGNNLLALLQGKTPKYIGYYSARLMPGAVIKTKPTDSSETVILDPATMAVLCRVDVCGIDSTNKSTWSKWVAVVIPAYGLGWVRSDQLVDVEVRSPSSCQLTALTLDARSNESIGERDTALELLAPLCSSLEYLDIHRSRVFESTSLLRQLLMQCPSLKALKVHHSGELWRGRSLPADSLLPRLQQLDLDIPYQHGHFRSLSLDDLQSSLSELEVLRVYPYEDHQYTKSKPAIESVLKHATKLRYFHLQHGLRRVGDSHLPFPYPQTRATTAQHLEEIKWPSDGHLFVDGTSFSASCIIAFLSVVSVRTHGSEEDASISCRTSAVQHLDRDVLENIFQFACSRVRRVIVIEPNATCLTNDPDYISRWHYMRC